MEFRDSTKEFWPRQLLFSVNQWFLFFSFFVFASAERKNFERKWNSVDGQRRWCRHSTHTTNGDGLAEICIFVFRMIQNSVNGVGMSWVGGAANAAVDDENDGDNIAAGNAFNSTTKTKLLIIGGNRERASGHARLRSYLISFSSAPLPPLHHHHLRQPIAVPPLGHFCLYLSISSTLLWSTRCSRAFYTCVKYLLQSPVIANHHSANATCANRQNDRK